MPKREFVPSCLNRKDLCGIWPRCCCSKTLKHWSKVIDEDKLPTCIAELAKAEVLIYYALECAGVYCPDKDVRMVCSTQLKSSWWDRMRRDEYLTEEVAEEIRQRWRAKQRPMIVGKEPA
jgi:hypothetical protein